MAVDLNINPYYDDFDEFKNFHQLLFKPGYAVQARELTQLQTIINDQIKKFGSHIFQQGSVVIPGNSFSDLYTPYVKLETSFGGQEIIPSSFADTVVIGATSGVRAIVRSYAAATSTDPLTLYVSYLSGGGTNGEYSTFIASEEIYSETDSTVRATVKPTTPTGYGSLAFIKSGVFFVNGRFVTVADDTVIISKYDSIPSCRVLLKITEEVVSSNEDSTLLDPAAGSYNFAAPGADRLKISLDLATLPLETEVDDNYVEIMRFRAGVLEEHARYPKYSELEKSLARRTYDESGDYVVSGFSVTVKEHLRTRYNDGVFEDINGGNRDKFVYSVEPGKSYIRGFEVEKIAPTTIVADKARTASHVKLKTYSSQPRYGQYLYVTELVKLPNFKAREKVELWSASTGGAKIGEAYVYAIDLLEGDATQSKAVYKLFYHDVTLTGTNKLHNVGRVVFASTGSAKVLTKYNITNITKDFFDAEDSPQDTITNIGSTRTAKVHRFVRSEGSLFVFRHDSTKEIPQEGDFITGSGVNTPTATVTSIASSFQIGYLPLIPVNVDSLKSITNESSTYSNLEYYAWTNVNITTDGSGNGTATITAATFVQPDTGIVVAAGPSGIVSPAKISLLSPTILKITAGPANETVTVLAQVKKTGVQPKSKVLTSLTLNNVVPSSLISLTVCDLYKVISILDASGNDVSGSYEVDNGQRDFYYDFARLKLVGTLPTSNLTIQLQYFDHVGSGDFFCVDSYATLGVDYIGRIPSYRSTNTSTIYSLKSVLDFRPRVDGNTGLFSSGGASLADAPVVDTILSTPVQYYVPRVDLIVLDKNGNLTAISGEPNQAPKKPTVPTDSMELYSVFVPAYTESAKSVVASLVSTKRFTMKDISKLENRISTIERLSILNSLENSVVQTEVIDPITGLNRFKSGYLVDNFSNPFLVSDVTSSGNTSSFYSKKFGPRKEGFIASAEIFTANGSANYRNTNGQFTLPYTETAFIDQNTSTKTLKLNPFSAVSWEGVLTIGPEFDRGVLNKNPGETVNPEDPGTGIIITPPPPRDPPVIPPKWPDKPVVPPKPPEPPIVEPPIPEPQKAARIDTLVNYVSEGGSITFTVVGTNFPNGAILNWQISGTGITSADFTDGALVGTVVVPNFTGDQLNKSNTYGTFTKTISTDAASEGTEWFSVTLTYGGLEYATKRIAIYDVAPPSPPTYSIVNTTASAYNGEPHVFEFWSTNVAGGTTLYYELEGINAPNAADASDFISPMTGSFVVDSNGEAVITIQTAENSGDSPVAEWFKINIKTSSGSSTVVASVHGAILSREPAGPPAPPTEIFIPVLARDIGQVDGLDSGEVNNTVINVTVTQDEYNAINEVIAGEVVDATVDVNKWLDVYATTLVATTQYGSFEWLNSVQNAVSYLRGLGYDGSPAGVSPGGEIYQMLDTAYTNATGRLRVIKETYNYTDKFPGQGV